MKNYLINERWDMITQKWYDKDSSLNKDEVLLDDQLTITRT